VVHGLHLLVVLFEVCGGVGVGVGVGGGRGREPIGLRMLKLCVPVRGVAATVRVEVPCSTALVVAFAFASAVVGVLLVVPISASVWSVVAGSEAEAVRSVVAGIGRSPVPPCMCAMT
jgi:hypothetical protein